MLSRHSSGVSETHLIISSSMYRPTSFQVSRGLHSTANPRPILTATGARDSESIENLGAPLVQYIALIVDVTVYGNTSVSHPASTEDERSCSGSVSHSRNRHALWAYIEGARIDCLSLRKFTEQLSCMRVPLALR